jgi:hypothetical protein
MVSWAIAAGPPATSAAAMAAPPSSARLVIRIESSDCLVATG